MGMAFKGISTLCLTCECSVPHLTKQLARCETQEAMDISIREAATRLGKSTRQVRYMLQNGDIAGRKESGRWLVDSAALPRSVAQQEPDRRRKRNIRAAVNKGLGAEDEPGTARYSLFDLKAVQIANALRLQSIEQFGPEHPVARALEDTLDRLIRGCHRYSYADKAVAYRAAREAACSALTALVVSGDDAALALIVAIEQELLAALAGLLRRLDKADSTRKSAE